MDQYHQEDLKVASAVLAKSWPRQVVLLPKDTAHMSFAEHLHTQASTLWGRPCRMYFLCEYGDPADWHPTDHEGYEINIAKKGTKELLKWVGRTVFVLGWVVKAAGAVSPLAAGLSGLVDTVNSDVETAKSVLEAFEAVANAQTQSVGLEQDASVLSLKQFQDICVAAGILDTDIDALSRFGRFAGDTLVLTIDEKEERVGRWCCAKHHEYPRLIREASEENKVKLRLEAKEYSAAMRSKKRAPVSPTGKDGAAAAGAAQSPPSPAAADKPTAAVVVVAVATVSPAANPPAASSPSGDVPAAAAPTKACCVIL